MTNFSNLANKLDRIYVEAGVVDFLSKSIERIQSSGMVSMLRHLSSLVASVPEKVANKLLSLSGWLEDLEKTLKTTTKKASLVTAKIDVKVILLVLNLIATLSGQVIHALEKAPQPRGELISSVTKMKNTTHELTIALSVGKLKLPTIEMAVQNDTLSEDVSSTK